MCYDSTSKGACARVKLIGSYIFDSISQYHRREDVCMNYLCMSRLIPV